MPQSPERLGKAHEMLTRDLLNGDEPQADTRTQLDYLDDDEQERVRVGAEKAAEFIRAHTDLRIERATEEGDARKTDPTATSKPARSNPRSSPPHPEKKLTTTGARSRVSPDTGTTTRCAAASARRPAGLGVRAPGSARSRPLVRVGTSGS